MAAIAPEGAAAVDEQVLPRAGAPAELWRDAAEAIGRWLDVRGLPARDAVVLLPFAALLPPLRHALAARGGWPPRVETALTLAAALAPPPALPADRCGGDPLLDALVVTRRLRRDPWARTWARRDPAGFALLVSRVQEAVDTLRAGAQALPPARRGAWWGQLRVLANARAASSLGAAGPSLPGGPTSAPRAETGPGPDDPRDATADASDAPPTVVEDRLLALAAELAAQSAPPGTDVLFELRPAAWIVVRLGGADPLAEALLEADGGPALRLRADPPDAAPLADAPTPALVERLVCDDAEAEARSAAAAVIAALEAGRAPVALVALDRLRTRRVRALLARQGVPMLDETGWRLATSAAATRLRARLLAASPDAGADARLAWLKTWPPARPQPRALQSLEAAWRGRRRVPDRPAGERLWAQAELWLEPWRAEASRPLLDWLTLLADQLRRDGTFDELAGDAAGRALLAWLRLDVEPEDAAGRAARSDAWPRAAAALRLDLHGFVAWVETALETATFDPLADDGALVVLTPLARAIGRPFGAAVLPGADHVNLGAAAPWPSLIDDRLAAALGLEGRAASRLRQRLALAHLLRLPAVTLLRRRQQAGEAVAESPDLAWLRLERLRAGAPDLPETPAVPVTQPVVAAPVPRPLPRVASALPEVLSASAVTALRECPYRFFARAVLRLDEPTELEAALAKRDYGDWLHLVLHRFHVARAEAAALASDDASRLVAAADEATAALGLDGAELLPFRASFEAFAPAYLRWLAAREAEGWRFQAGETEREVAPAALAPTRLAGRIDRLDSHPDGGLEVIDYKTGRADDFKRLVKDRLEDTQLAFYAALLERPGQGPGPLRAAYLALDGREAPVRIEHTEVRASAAALVEGLGGELARLRAGAPLPALGEGGVCEFCEARGLCRRDHWLAP